MKKLTLIILSFCLFISNSAFAVEYGEELKNMPENTYEQTFSDVPTTNWAFQYISELVNDNVLSGYPDGQFRPNNNVTRAEFAKIMISASGIQVKPATSTSFEDVAVTDWYCSYIESSKEFLTGFQYGGSAMYLPNKAAIREDIAVALVKLKGYDISVADLGMLQTMFSDYDSISESAKRYVAVAVERGLVSGYDDGTFRGQKSITRAEAATLIWRANQYGSDNKIIGSETTEITPTPVPVQTQAPTVVPTSEPTAEPTEEPTPTPKPYKIDKLADACLEDYLSFTQKGNEIYYIDNEDDCIYEINIDNGKKTKFTENLSSLTLKKEDSSEENTVIEYTDYIAEQIHFDAINDRLLLIGYYEKAEIPFKEAGEVTYYVIYDISNGDYEVLCELKDECNGLAFIAALNRNEYCVIYKHSYFSFRAYKLNTETGGLSKLFPDSGQLYANSLIRNNNDIYFIDGHSAFAIEKYDFSDNSFSAVTDSRAYIPMDSIGIKDDCYYYWYNDEFKKISVSSGKVSELEINTLSSNVAFDDMGALVGISERMIVVNDYTFIFYDHVMQAFRKLEKNN